MDGVLLAWKMLLYIHMEAEQESPTGGVDMATLQPGMFTSLESRLLMSSLLLIRLDFVTFVSHLAQSAFMCALVCVCACLSLKVTDCGDLASQVRLTQSNSTARE